jgi:hypothetical protein
MSLKDRPMAKAGFTIAAITSTLALAGAVPLLAFAAPYQNDADSAQVEEAPSVAGIPTKDLRDRDIKRLTRMLEGREAGEARQCIRLRQVRRSANIGDDILIYEMRGGDILVNRTAAGCSNLSRNGIVNVTPNDFICKGQIFEVRDFLAGITLGSCAYGDFVEYTKTGEDSAD